MMYLLCLIVFMLIFDYAALRWGIDSREIIYSIRWQKYRQRHMAL